MAWHSNRAAVWIACCLILSTFYQVRTEPADQCYSAAATVPFPHKTAYGRVFNKPFSIDRSFLNYEPVVISPGKSKRSLVLDLEQGAIPCGTESYKGNKRVAFSSPRVAFKINFWQGNLACLSGKTIVIDPGKQIRAISNYPMVTVETHTVARQRSSTCAADLAWPDSKKIYLIGGSKYDYGMRLVFDQLSGDKLSGYISLRVADPDHSFIEGYFCATVRDDWTTFRHMKPLENLSTDLKFPE